MNTYTDIFYSSQPYISESAIPSRNCLHCMSVVFSPDSERISFIDMNNQIKTIDLQNKTVSSIVDNIDYHISSLGYLDQNKLWIGVISEEYIGNRNNSKVIFYDLKLKENIDVINFGTAEYLNPSLVPLFSTEGNKSVILVGYRPSPLTIPHYSDITLYTCDQNQYFTICSFSYYSFSCDSRLKYLNNKNIIKILFLDFSGYNSTLSWGDLEYDLSEMKVKNRNIIENVTKENPQANFSKEGFLLQPFSPDGEEFLHLYQGKLYIYNTDTLEGRQILPSVSSVTGFEKIRDN